MADFKTHIGTSTLAGIGYGVTGYALGAPPASCLIAAGACSVAGMLPDLDSDSGVPVREMMCFMAAVVPALMIPRFREMGWDTEQIVLAAGLLYVAIRFGVVAIFRKYTVHRGMWHSIPAAVTVSLMVFLLASGDDVGLKLFKSIAVFLGFMIHLVLDEIWSFEQNGATIRVKKSFGTALKFWTTKGMWPNISTYGKLAIVSILVVGDPYLMEQLGAPQYQLPRSPGQWVARFGERSGELMHRLQCGCIMPEQHDEQDLSIESTAQDSTSVEGSGASPLNYWQPGATAVGDSTAPAPSQEVPSAADRRYEYPSTTNTPWGSPAPTYGAPAAGNPRYAPPSGGSSGAWAPAVAPSGGNTAPAQPAGYPTGSSAWR